MKHIISTERKFKLWHYNVSHGRVLLRSTKSANNPTRIDILFTDVQRIELNTTLENLSIIEYGEVKDQSMEITSLLKCGYKLFKIESKNSIGNIVAGAFYSMEDEKEYNQPSTLWEI
jgi:hypothetical protein